MFSFFQRKKPRKHHSQNRKSLSLESLECRQVMAANLMASLSNYGVLSIEGTERADRIDVSQVEGKINVAGIRIRDNTAGGSMVSSISASKISQIVVRGLGGSDSIELGKDKSGEEWTNIPSWIYGGSGNDIIDGTAARDHIYGELGNDKLYGYGGDDLLDGDIGDDKLYGGDGDDTLYGFAGADQIFGEVGNDTLYGGEDNDKLYGQDGNDGLYGGNGADHLSGGEDNDGLFGGRSASIDTLEGGGGSDRFLLVGNEDAVKDLAPKDARLVFSNAEVRWTDAEIEVVDQAFAVLHQMTGNTRLLKDPVYKQPLTFVKVNSFDDGDFAGENAEFSNHRIISILNWDASDEFANAETGSTVAHEIAHNWDTPKELKAAGVNPLLNKYFNDLSDWRTSLKGVDKNQYQKSEKGSWYYLTRADFVRHYARTNPDEDWACSFEAYFDLYRANGTFGPSGGFGGDSPSYQAKLDAVDAVLNALS